ncbi:MAG: acetolactate synthase small subunit [Marinifilaceae bacterium]
MENKYIITVYTENKVGLMGQITTVFTYRDVNLESITASESAVEGVHKFVLVVHTTQDKVKQLVKQLEKKIDILKACYYQTEEVIRQELALYKVSRNSNMEQLIRQHNIRILEIEQDYMVLEKTGHQEEIANLFDMLQPYGVQQFVRSGAVAITKNNSVEENTIL